MNVYRVNTQIETIKVLVKMECKSKLKWKYFEK